MTHLVAPRVTTASSTEEPNERVLTAGAGMQTSDSGPGGAAVVALYVAHDFTYANEAAREGATGLVAGDVGKIAYQSDTGLYWELTDDDPVTWAEHTISMSGMSNPMTTAADIIVGGASGTPARLAKGTGLQVLRMNSGATALEWATAGAGGVATLLLDYRATTDIATPATLTADTWTDLGTNQTFTVTDATAQIVIAIGGAVTVGNSATPGNVGSRLVVDSAGTPITKFLTCFFRISGAYHGGPIGGPAISIGNLSAGDHTVKSQIFFSGDTTNLYCRPSTQPNFEGLYIQVWQVN